MSERAGGGLVAAIALTLGCEAVGPAAGGDAGDGWETGSPRLVVTTTDFSTGAVSVLDTGSGAVRRDVALASTDALPFTHDGLVYVVNRFMFDYVDVLDPDQDWALLGQHPVDAPGIGSTNPQALAFDGQGRAWVGMYGAAQLNVYDFGRSEGAALVSTVSLSEIADPDGITEVSQLIPHGDHLWILVRQLDQTSGLAAIGPDRLFAVDTRTEALIDLDPDEPGVTGLELPGDFHRQWREDPTDPDAVFSLSTGIVRVDLATPGWAWVVPPEAFDAVGIGSPFLPQSFDVVGEGAFVVAAYEADFSGVELYSASSAEGLTPLVEGLNSVERTLEVVDDAIWYGDATVGASGMRRFGLDGEADGAGATSTGLAPYAVAPLD